MDTALTVGSEIKTIRELIDKMARTQPEAKFLISPETGRLLTFRGLQEQSSILSAQLLHLGLEFGDKIAFLMDNGLFTVQMFLGAIYGGFVSVPLNVRAGVSQLSYTLDHCDAKGVFVEQQYTSLINEVMTNVRRPVHVIPADVDSFASEMQIQRSTVSITTPAPEDEALLMYTSGSTGQPKAAVHSHRTLLAHARNSICSHQLSSSDRSLLVLPLYHINAECVTLGPTLLSGGSVVVPHHFNVSHFWDWLEEYHCTWSALVPTIISQLLDWKDPRADSREAAFRRIRFLRSSSAPLSPSLHREFLDKYKLLLIQAMGSSEAGNIFSNPLPPGENKIGSPGLPWGFETKIVNGEGAEVPPEEPGEVLIRGPAITRGYYKEPEATAAVLDSDGWLHTGDLAYRDKDGYFFVVGRSKELIIKGGMNIAPRQIDEVLESHPSVLEAAVTGVPDRYLGEDLSAFVVLRKGFIGDERELLSLCESRLGHFKTPTRIHFVKDLPKGPSGKVQRLRLLDKAPDATVAASVSSTATGGDSQTAHGGLLASGSSIEQAIAETWAELLAQREVDIHSNFFSLGGHSLMAIQCLSRLRDKLPIALSLTDFFENATITQLAELVRRRLCADNHADGQSSSDPAATNWEQALLQQVKLPAAPQRIPPRDRTLPCPLSPAQQRVWFFEQLVPEVPLYNESEAVRLEGELNEDALEQALNAVIARHEILRSTIQVRDGQPMVVGHESWPLRLKKIDLSTLDLERRQAEVGRLLIDEPRLRYCLEAEPGIRATLVRLNAREHVLILMMHHLVCDWSSEGVIWREMSAAYRAISHGEPLNLPLLPIQHSDYAAWQQQMTDASFAEDLAYWEENLRGAPELLELPTDRQRPSTNSYRGARQRFQLNSALATALRDCSRREKTSLFTVFAAALNVLLYRYTGQEDILVGIPLADRDRAELQSMIGFLLHTHVLRTELSGDMTFRQLLARVQKGVLELYAHRAVPFDHIVSGVKPERNLSYSPLFQVMINWRDRDQQLSFIGMEGLAVESLLAESRTSKFDLTMMLTDGGDEIWLEMEYSTDLFDDTRIARMVGHYKTLLTAVANDSSRNLEEVPLLTEAERQQLMFDWNRTETAYPKDRCLHELIEEQVKRRPDDVAVTFEGARLTYGGLDQRANQLARHLRKLGVGPNTLVGIYMERSLEMVIGLLGILKAGGAYVPMDPKYPRERVAFMLEDSNPRVMVTQEKLRSDVPSYSGPVVCLDRVSRPDSDGSGEMSPPCPTDLAYVLYTSGSTGRPKGVAIEHHSAVALTGWARSVFTNEEFAGVLGSTSICFDLSVFELFVTLACGGKVILAENALALPSLPEANEVKLINTVPSAIAELVRVGGIPPSVITINLAGEPLVPSLVDELYKLPSIRKVCDLYGPTESTTYSTWTLRKPGGRATIGRPISNTRVYILDRRLQPVPIGVPGELYIGGDGLARGYHNRPELTAEKFIANPFSTEPGARLYKTGDLTRYLPDGNIEYLGRLDHQVKIRGFRIELGEIEAVLRQHSAVRESVVLAREDVPGHKSLAAYVIPKTGIKPIVEEVRSYLKAKLPDAMVPSTFVFLDRFPLSPNGKVDRKALPAPDQSRPELGAAYVAPRTETEEVLSLLWAEILSLKQVGIHDNFFELGGHSLLASGVISRIRSVFRIEIGLRTLFEKPTVAGLASVVDQQCLEVLPTEELGRLVEEIENIPEEEARMLLEGPELK